MKLKNKTAIITGAARGIGRACAYKFAENGADLILTDIGHQLAEVPYCIGTRSQLLMTAEKCREHNVSVCTEYVDVRSLNEISRMIENALCRFGKIDVIVNCAGIAAPSGKPTHEITEEEWNLMLDIDLTGAWRLIKKVGPQMIQQRFGSIINISSTAGVVGYRNFSSYVTAKHGLVGLTKAAALDYASYNVRVNAICPGSVEDNELYEGKMLSEIAKALSIDQDDYESVFLQSQPNNQLVKPEDIGNTTVWLASDDTVRVTGSIIVVDGGFTSK
ncbi:MAG: SDR family oxidoreductase [Clostridiales bacterium]|jgi:NAD(P)-dependent dehydrogenase (short-subunit alcohol dehydrogenase family)|nr:SDR family oxidoreductase [Clostridiales bacterium]